jgi:hypothetical protein
LCLACGAPPSDGPQLAAGQYLLNVTVHAGATVGDCNWLRGTRQSEAAVDSNGQIGDLFPGTKCRTTYPLEVECSGLGASLKARGELWPDAGAEGVGLATGDIGGCKSAVFTFVLFQEGP